MYKSAATGKFYVFVTSDGSGDIEQWEVFDDGKGRVDGKKVRALKFGGQCEGCVADDEFGIVYLGEEDRGIWKFGAEPNDETPRVLVDSTAGGKLKADVEGLTLYKDSDKTGYLIASSQGDDSFIVYTREGKNDFVAKFKIVRGDKTDGAEDSDGIDVVNVDLGPSFPKGLFVAQNGSNDGKKQNFLMVPWEAVAEPCKLRIDTTPR
jgi:3-phytase